MSIFSMSSSFGENNRMLDGLFINLPRIKFVDPTFERTLLAHEWLSLSDIYRSNRTSLATVNPSLAHSLENYHVPTAAAAINTLCRVDGKSDLVFTTKELFEYNFKREANAALVGRFTDGLAPRLRAYLDGRACSTG